ncbi:MAG: competence/damage-inducible protein A [Elusimicrobiota bacterium]|jgi:nicotinamide-nucleotide amidase|nr:competence/damage-inducible protein A [Elusimicrobiota bacterium]
MRVELICSGTELLTGKVNTNAGYIGEKLYALGLELAAVIDVSDRKNEFMPELKRALDRSDIIITTGGLGPTFDDITVETAAECLGREIYFDQSVLDDIKSFFEKRKIFEFTKNNERQANIIKGATVLHNNNGTAPGQMIDFEGKIGEKITRKTLFLLPGPPREMKAMFDERIEPFLKSYTTTIKKNELIHIGGLGESFVEDLIKPIIDSATFGNDNVEFGILAHNAMIDVKYSVSGLNEMLIDQTMKNIKSEIEKLLKDNIFGYAKDTLQGIVGQLLKEKNKTLSLAESCTGGMIAQKITDISGSSAYFMGSAITYSNDSKIKLLGVKEETLKNFGAVSAQTAEEMAQGALKLYSADFALSVTGIAGPDGGSKEKPVGLVYIGIASKKAVKSYEYNFIGNRHDIRERTANTALNLLRLTIKNS